MMEHMVTQLQQCHFLLTTVMCVFCTI